LVTFLPLLYHCGAIRKSLSPNVLSPNVLLQCDDKLGFCQVYNESQMINTLYVYNLSLRGAVSDKGLNLSDYASESAVVWQTCVRQTLISTQPVGELISHHPNLSMSAGREAYEFLVQVVCGLHSPMIGETEVHGQFKERIDHLSAEVSSDLRKALLAVHFIARKVRQSCLTGLGSQSYGSFARKQLVGVNHLLTLGAGQLARDIWPWITKSKTRITVMSRSAKSLPYPCYFFGPLIEIGGLTPPDALLVAAPMASSAIVKQVYAGAPRPRITLDFRAESRHDPLPKNFNVLDLETMFREIESGRRESELRLEKARREIRLAVADIEGSVGRQLASVRVS
jgi:glutamyl-tRNA reductase